MKESARFTIDHLLRYLKRSYRVRVTDSQRRVLAPPDRQTEETLRRWAGGVLTGAHGARPAPVADARVVKRFARRHGLLAYLAHGTAPAEGGGDESGAWSRQNAVALEMARRSAFVAGYEQLAGAIGRKPLVFKGQALAHTLYPQPWFRPRSDTDILLDRDDMPAAIEALTALGYTPDASIPGDLLLTQQSLRKRSTGVEHAWDLHWRLSNRPAFAQLLDHEELRTEARPVRLDRIVFQAPGPVHSLLIACLHLAGHHLGEVRLIWLQDIHLLASSLTDAEVERFLARASDSPVLRGACHAALALTWTYLPAERTGAWSRQLDPGPGARLGTDRRHLTRLVQDVRAVGSRRWPSLLRQHLFPPAGYMMHRFRIRHRWQLPFWYVVRIGRALPKLLKRH